jgi:hypothetical protein
MTMTKSLFRIILPVLILSIIYAVLRYHVFKGVDWRHFPLYTMNKIFSVSGFTLLVLSIAFEPVTRDKDQSVKETRINLERTGLVMIILHILTSLLLFRPAVYEKFFLPEGTLNMTGEASMLFGALGIAAFLIIHHSRTPVDPDHAFQNFIPSPVFRISALTISCIHVVIMGFKGWLSPADWPGGLPPLTMLTTIIFLAGMAGYSIIRAKKPKQFKSN